jgi:hypothetical protein
MPRDPERISIVIDTLKQFWERNPDFRFGQLVMGIARTGEPAPKLFNMEDDEFLKHLIAMDREMEANKKK